MTSLEWQVEPAGPMGQAEAAAYASGLGDGWRLPTVVELVGLWDYSAGGCPMFPWADGWFWTNQAYVGPDASVESPTAWAVLFRDGSLDDVGLTFPAMVRCVREVQL